MTLGLAERQTDLLDELTRFCDEAVAEGSVYAFLHRERDRLFPDEAFADLFQDVGRRCIPPSIVATVMVLQRLEGCSDREAVDRFTFDARWRYSCGVGGWTEALTGFVHTVLVDMRARLAASKRPRRVFEVTLEVAWAAGLVGRRRVLDSTPIYDAVATMDTVTLVRQAIRGLLGAAEDGLAAALRAALGRDDDYRSPGKPACDWDDPEARQALVDALTRDAVTLLAHLDGLEASPEVAEAAELLATVVGQDIEQGQDGVFRIARLEEAEIVPVVKVQAPNAPAGHFPKDRFAVDLELRTVTCPGEVTVPLRPRKGGAAAAEFGRACRSCPLAPSCTTSPKGRVITIGPHEAEIARGRERQRHPAWADDYRATRPKVERKIAHLMRRRHGGRRARVRGQPKVDQDFSLLGAAVNLARLSVLGVHAAAGGWSVARAPT